MVNSPLSLVSCQMNADCERKKESERVSESVDNRHTGLLTVTAQCFTGNTCLTQLNVFTECCSLSFSLLFHPCTDAISSPVEA